MTGRELTTLEYLRAMRDGLDELDGKTVERHVRIHRGGADRDLDDLADRVSERLGRRLRREGLL